MTTTPPAPTACATSQLQASLGGGTGAGMSHLHTGMQLRNVSKSTCILYGYPGVSWVAGSQGHQVGPAASRSQTPGPGLVTLTPGGLASAALDIIEGDGGLPTSECRPVPVRGLRVYPPGQRDALFVPATYEGVGVCSVATPQSLLGIGPTQAGVQPGSGGSG